jgi:hypothetical protein
MTWLIHTEHYPHSLKDFDAGTGRFSTETAGERSFLGTIFEPLWSTVRGETRASRVRNESQWPKPPKDTAESRKMMRYTPFGEPEPSKRSEISYLWPFDRPVLGVPLPSHHDSCHPADTLPPPDGLTQVTAAHLTNQLDQSETTPGSNFASSAQSNGSRFQSGRPPFSDTISQQSGGRRHSPITTTSSSDGIEPLRPPRTGPYQTTADPFRPPLPSSIQSRQDRISAVGGTAAVAGTAVVATETAKRVKPKKPETGLFEAFLEGVGEVVGGALGGL